MESFPISPGDCLILKAIRDSDTLRGAAQLLRCDPAGLHRRARQIADQYGYLQKVDGRWRVSPEGRELAAWVELGIESQKRILAAKANLRLASTVWFAEEVLIPGLPRLAEHFTPSTPTVALSSPGSSFEAALSDGEVDFVIACHPPENPEIEHRKIMAEEWVVIAPRAWASKAAQEDALAFLRTRPFIRHREMNLDLFWPNLADEEVTEASVTIDHLIGVRSAVASGLGWSLVPRFLIRRHGEAVVELDVRAPIEDRHVCLWWQRHRRELKRQSAKIAAWIAKI